jgi:hypothetical protein
VSARCGAWRVRFKVKNHAAKAGGVGAVWRVAGVRLKVKNHAAKAGGVGVGVAPESRGRLKVKNLAAIVIRLLVQAFRKGMHDFG